MYRVSGHQSGSLPNPTPACCLSFLGLLSPCFSASSGWYSHRLRHRASPASKGGTDRRPHIPAPSAPRFTVVKPVSPCSGTIVLRCASGSLRCTCEPDCHQPPRFFANPTPVPLNTNRQRIQSVLVLSCRVAPPLTLRASLPPLAPTGAAGVVATGRRQSGSLRLPTRLRLAGIPPLTLLPARR